MIDQKALENLITTLKPLAKKSKSPAVRNALESAREMMGDLTSDDEEEREEELESEQISRDDKQNIEMLNSLIQMHHAISKESIDPMSLMPKKDYIELYNVISDVIGALLLSTSPQALLQKGSRGQSTYELVCNLLQLGYPSNLFFKDIYPSVLSKNNPNNEYIFDVDYLSSCASLLGQLKIRIQGKAYEVSQSISSSDSEGGERLDKMSISDSKSSEKVSGSFTGGKTSDDAMSLDEIETPEQELQQYLDCIQQMIKDLEPDELWSVIPGKKIMLATSIKETLEVIKKYFPETHAVYIQAEKLTADVNEIKEDFKEKEKEIFIVTDKREAMTGAPTKRRRVLGPVRSRLKTAGLRKEDISHHLDHENLEKLQMDMSTFRVECAKNSPALSSVSFEKLKDRNFPTVTLNHCAKANVDYINISVPKVKGKPSPVVVKFLGSDGDCEKGLRDYYGEAMRNNASIVAFNYNLDHSPTDVEIVQQGADLVKQVLKENAGGNGSAVTLDGHSFGAAIAVMVAAQLKSEGIDVAVVHDRGFESLVEPASDAVKGPKVVKKLAKVPLKIICSGTKFNFQMQKAWETLDDSQKRMYFTEQDTMKDTISDTLKRDAVSMEFNDDTLLTPMGCYSSAGVNDREDKVHLATMQAGTVKVKGHTENAEKNKYAFIHQRLQADLSAKAKVGTKKGHVKSRRRTNTKSNKGSKKRSMAGAYQKSTKKGKEKKYATVNQKKKPEFPKDKKPK